MSTAQAPGILRTLLVVILLCSFLLSVLPVAVSEHESGPCKPLDVVWNLDWSGSVPDIVKDWARTFSLWWIDNLTQPERGAAIKFAEKAVDSGSLTDDLASVARWLRANKPEPMGHDTDLLAALSRANAIYSASTPLNRRVEAFFTDGGDTMGNTDAEVLAKALEAASLDVTIHVIAWNPEPQNVPLLGSIAAVTGGNFRIATTYGQLLDAFAAARAEQCLIVSTFGEVRWLRLALNNTTVHLWWEAVAEAVGYEVFGGPSPRALDFRTPIANATTNETSVPAPDASEWYYVVRAVGPNGTVSFTSPTAGFYLLTVDGPTAFGLPVESFEPVFSTNLTARWMTSDGRWTDDERLLAPGIGLYAEGPARTCQFHGMPAAHIRWKPGGPRLVTAEVVGSNLSLSWTDGDPWFRVVYAPDRTGFWYSLDVRWEGTGYAATVPLSPGYFMVLDQQGRSTYSVGVYRVGGDPFAYVAFPGRPLRVWTAESWVEASGARGLAYLKGNAWRPHFAEMPAGAYDPILAFPAAFEVDGGQGAWVLTE